MIMAKRYWMSDNIIDWKTAIADTHIVTPRTIPRKVTTKKKVGAAGQFEVKFSNKIVLTAQQHDVQRQQFSNATTNLNDIR